LSKDREEPEQLNVIKKIVKRDLETVAAADNDRAERARDKEIRYESTKQRERRPSPRGPF